MSFFSSSSFNQQKITSANRSGGGFGGRELVSAEASKHRQVCRDGLFTWNWGAVHVARLAIVLSECCLVVAWEGGKKRTKEEKEETGGPPEGAGGGGGRRR